MNTDTPTTEAAPAEAKPLFTAREEEVLRAAMFCLKSPPEVDMQLLVKQAGFNTPKTAANVWATIKKKLVTALEAKGDGFTAKADALANTAAKDATPGKKRVRKTAAADTDVEAAPKKQRKSAKKPAADDSDSALSPVKEELLTDTKVINKRKAPVKKAEKVDEADADADADAENDA